MEIFYFSAEYYNAVRSIRMFNQESDWVQELKRCNAMQGENGWRVLELNPLEYLTLPRFIVVPFSLSLHEYSKTAQSFRCQRSVIWVWGLENAALVRLADILPGIADNTMENIVLEHVRRSDRRQRQPNLLELDKILPSINDVQNSYLKLRRLCSPESYRHFMVCLQIFTTFSLNYF